MDIEKIGQVLLLVGLGIMALGGVLLLLSRIPGLNQLFNLPGDIRVQMGGLSCFVPLVSMIIISVVLTVIANILLRIFNR
jgi:hypothetical protein